MKKKHIDITTDAALIFSAVMLILFTVAMIVIFCIFQSIPDTLVTCVFGLLSGEAVISFFLWYIKKRYREGKK